MAHGVEVTAFLEDLFENLGVIEGALGHLEEDATQTESLRDIFRAAHTIKGNASMMNLTNLVALGHALETALQEALNGSIELNRDTLRLFSEARLAMAAIGVALGHEGDTGQIAIRDTTDRIQVLLLEGQPQPAAPTTGQERELEITLRIDRAEVAPSVRAFLVETKLAELGRIVSKEPSDEKLESPDFLTSERKLKFVLHTAADMTDVRENLNIDLIEGVQIAELAMAQAEPQTPAKIEQSRVHITQEIAAPGGDTIRLTVKTLDRLLNLTGELVIAGGGLNHIADDVAHIPGASDESLRLTEKNREIFRIAAEIQSIVMKSRMLPIEHVFSRFKRFVRDYADKAGKAIRLEVSGAETELDKRVIDEIIKPLTHLIRNSLDHGFETPAERIAAGKSAEGTLKISAEQAGSNILITVEDDGRGMNHEKILERAIEKGLVDTVAATRLTPEAIREFIFMPGFSTKDSADDLSGRGFGMDIVRDSIKKLSGDLTVTSREGKGTRMVIRLPLTLAILTALTFKIRNDVFAIPLASVEESMRVPSGSILDVDGHEMLHTRNTMLPFIRIDRVLGYPRIDDVGKYVYVIVADLHGRSFALGVDELLKKHELVVKSLDENYAKVPGLAGASITGDSEIIFIVDAAEIVELHDRRHLPSFSNDDGEATFGMKTSDSVAAKSKDTLTGSEPVLFLEKTGEEKMQPLIDIADKELVRKWIAQSNKTAVQGIQMLTGKSAINVKKSRGSRVKADKSHTLIEKISSRIDDIYLFHLPILPGAGAIDLILTRKSAERMAKLLFDAAGIKQEEFDAGPLMEITNILGSAYTNTLTFLTEKSVEPATPTFLSTPDEIRKVLDERRNAPRSEVLVIENQFRMENEDIEVELLIYLAG